MLHVNWLIILQKPFHQYQSDRTHLYLHISCIDFCLNLLREVENAWK